MKRLAIPVLVGAPLIGVAIYLSLGASSRPTPAAGSTEPRAVMVVGSGTVVEGIFNPLKSELSRLAGVTLVAQDHGSGMALLRASEPSRQPAIAVRSSRAHDADFDAARRAPAFRCVAAFVIAYDELAFWVHEDHPLRFIDLEKLNTFLFTYSDDRALPAWSSVGLPQSDEWGRRKIAILMPRGPRNGGEDSGTRREAERLLSGNDAARFTLEGQHLRTSLDIRVIPRDVEKKTAAEVAPMGLASAAFIGSSKVRPLAIYDSKRQRNVEFPARPLWAYVLIPRSGPTSAGVLRIIQSLLSDEIQARLAGIHFKRISEGLRSEQLKTLSALGAGECRGGRTVNGLTIVEPPDQLLAK